jgi:FkbM family methyltransferase
VKNVAYVNYCGRRVKIVAKYRPMLAAAVAKMYHEDAVQRVRNASRKEVKVIVDVGASIGHYSMFFALAHPNAEVYALEPSSECYPDLVENAEEFDKIHPMKFAAWDKNEDVEIALTTNEQKDYLHHVENVGQISILGESEHYRERVQARKLDDMFTRIDYLKVDAEGADMNVLDGARGLIEECKPVLQVEMSPDNLEMAGLTCNGYLKYLGDLGYGLQALWVNDFMMIPTELMTEEERARKYKFTVSQGKVWVQEYARREDTAN